MNILRTIYICVGIAFFLVGIGNIINMHLTWTTMNIGQKIAAFFGMLINFGVGAGVIWLYKGSKQQTIMTDTEFAEITKSMKKEGKQHA